MKGTTIYTNARVLPVLDVFAVIVKSVHQLHCIIGLYMPICIIVIVNLTGSTQMACCYTRRPRVKNYTYCRTGKNFHHSEWHVLLS